uniref:Uncharacterized protein n=1 Tax=Populus trichocarpa TaxID=3694 RepID=A0A2K2AUH8_POPTR
MVSDKGVLEILNTHLRDAIINHHCSTQHAFEVRVQFWAIGINTPGKEIYKKLLFPLFSFSNIWTNLRTGVLFFDG